MKSSKVNKLKSIKQNKANKKFGYEHNFFYFSSIVIKGARKKWSVIFLSVYHRSLKNRSLCLTSDILMLSAFKDKWSVF